MQVNIKDFNLYLVRHGLSEANVDRDIHKIKSDNAMRLDPRGIEQAKEAGVFLAEHLYRHSVKDPDNFGKIRLWHTPYYRGRETSYHILRAIAKKFVPESHGGPLSYREDPFLYEQHPGVYDVIKSDNYAEVDPVAAADYKKHALNYGRSYANTPLGESRMAVVIRVKPHFGTILRDQETKDINHVIDVSHGVTVRAETMAWMHYPPEWLDAEKNPGNCWVRYIHGNSNKGYKDEGYIFGEKAPLYDRMATQSQLQGAENVYMLKPSRPSGIVPPGITPFDPFADYKAA